MGALVIRQRHLAALNGLLTRHPVVAILGARQTGKTTLAQQLLAQLEGPKAMFDLEDPLDLARLDDPRLALTDLAGLVVIDEVQLRPDLFPVLRVLVDRADSRSRFLLLGSASPELLRQSSESLAGRIHYHELGGFALDEVDATGHETLWHRGGFPRSFLAESDAESLEWRHDFVRTFLERDLPQLGVRIPAGTLRRFWTMVAHYHGQIWNGAELARAFGVSGPTVRRYLDLLTATFVVRQLPPFHENLSKRQVKSPKVYVTDSGILHALLDLETPTDVDRHPKVGASWEGFAIGQVVSRLGARPEQCFSWGLHAGAELDLLVVKGRRRLGFELKRTSAPRTTKSMHSALEHLDLERLDVVYPGDQTFQLRDRIRAVGIARLLEDIEPLTSDR